MSRTGSLQFILSIFDGAASLAKILMSLILIRLTLGWKVRTARKAFERELIKQGMAKHDARRISAQYAALKDTVENAFNQYLMKWR